MSTFHLFVYGTLRGAGGAAGMLEGCELVGPARVGGILYDIDGRFPALVMYGADPVQGEVWRCPAALLRRLDEYEGVGHGLFRRVAQEVRTDAGALLPCWLYTAGPALSRRLLPERRIRSGAWRQPDAAAGVADRAPAAE